MSPASESLPRSNPQDDLRELLWLRDETLARMQSTLDAAERWKLYKTLQELLFCIEKLQPKSR